MFGLRFLSLFSSFRRSISDLRRCFSLATSCCYVNFLTNLNSFAKETVSNTVLTFCWLRDFSCGRSAKHLHLINLKPSATAAPLMQWQSLGLKQFSDLHGTAKKHQGTICNFKSEGKVQLCAFPLNVERWPFTTDLPPMDNVLTISWQPLFGSNEPSLLPLSPRLIRVPFRDYLNGNLWCTRISMYLKL